MLRVQARRFVWSRLDFPSSMTNIRSPIKSTPSTKRGSIVYANILPLSWLHARLPKQTASVSMPTSMSLSRPAPLVRAYFEEHDNRIQDATVKPAKLSYHVLTWYLLLFVCSRVAIGGEGILLVSTSNFTTTEEAGRGRQACQGTHVVPCVSCELLAWSIVASACKQQQILVVTGSTMSKDVTDGV